MANCPPTDTLAAFLNGDLADDDIVTLDQHIEKCADCIAQLEQLTPREQSVLPDAVSEHDPFVMEPQCKQLIGRFQQTDDTHPDPVTVGPYQIIERIGFGGVGAVYKAEHSLLGKVVALKVLKDAGNEESTARFLREMRATGELKHPNIVQATDGGIDDGRHYFVMEYLEGLNLSELSVTHGPLAIADACELIRQTAVGLQHIHEAGLVHRDLKPRNLVLAKTDRGVEVKILDLGLASVRQPIVPEESLTQTGQVMGTVDYMAPEQALDSHDVDIRADIYALGATLYKLLCGQAPFQSASYNTFGRKFSALLSQSPDPISDRRSDLPAPIVEVLERMMHREPDERFATPTNVMQALMPFCDGHDLPALLDSPDAAAQETCIAAETMTVASVDSSTAETFVGSRSKESPTLPITEIRSTTRTPVRRLLVIAGGLLGAIVLGAVLYIQMGKATLIVRIGDPEFTATVVSDGVEISGGETPIKLSPGEHRLRVSRGEFSFETDNFQLSRGEKEVLSVELVQGSVEVVRDGQTIKSMDLTDRNTKGMRLTDSETTPEITAEVDQDRMAAEWVVARGGIIIVAGIDALLQSVPKEPFELIEVRFSAETGHVDDLNGGEILNGLQHLERITLFEFGDDFVEMLDDLPVLDGIALIDGDAKLRPKFSDSALPLLNRYPRLTRFTTERTNITNEGLIELTQTPFGRRLHSFTVNGSMVNDELLEVCGKLPNLAILEFNYSNGITVEGLRHLCGRPLSMLNMYSTPLSPDCIPVIAEIETLTCANFGNNRLAFTDLHPLQQLPLLSTLHIPWVRGDRSELDELRQLLPKVTIFSDLGEDAAWNSRFLDDRAAVEWLLTDNPYIEIQVNNDGARIRTLEELPTGSIQLTYIGPSDAAVKQKRAIFDYSRMDRLNGLKHLKTLVSYIGFSDEALSQLSDLPSLVQLELARHPNEAGMPATTNRSVDSLLRYPNLKRLSLAFTEFTDEGIGTLLARPEMLQLEELYLGQTATGRSALSQIRKLPKLRELRINQCEGVVDHFDLLVGSDLVSLDLYGTLITDELVESISKLQRLEYLNICGTGVTADQIIQIGQMPTLKGLLCDLHELPDTDIQRITKALPKFEIAPDSSLKVIRQK